MKRHKRARLPCGVQHDDTARHSLAPSFQHLASAHTVHRIGRFKDPHTWLA